MAFKQLKPKKYEYFTEQLIKKARQEPLNANFDTAMVINNKEYILKIQPEKKRKVYILQALMVEREEFGQVHTLITDNRFLLALLEILIYQGI